MFHLVYKRVSTTIKADYLLLFLRLCSDETPAVRRAAAQNLFNMVKVTESKEALSDLMAAFKSFIRDDQVCRAVYQLLALKCVQYK